MLSPGDRTSASATQLQSNIHHNSLKVVSFASMSAAEIQIRSGLCNSCQHLGLAQLVKNERAVVLGPVEQFFSRPECDFCRLVSSIFRRPWVEGGYSKEIIDSQLCSSTMGCVYMNGRREQGYGFLQLSVPTARFPLGVGPAEMLSGYIEPAIGENFDPTIMSHKPGRPLQQIISFEVIRQWLRSYDQSHSQCSQIRERNWHRLPSSFRLIDVQKRCLVDVMQRCRYIALSYVWGTSLGLKTTKSTVHQLSMNEAFDDSKIKIPQVVKSAIEFLRGLSERYLWVDALCIVQDDEADVSDQISRMDAIYSSAYATLIAAAGASSECRLLGLSNSPRILKQSIEIIHGAKYIARSLNLNDRLLGTTWNTRGWTYQEQVLSSRCIFVFDDECCFECGNDSCYESSLRSEGPQRHKASSWILKAPKDIASSEAEKQHIDGFISQYFANVLFYTKRKLTNPTDVLRAFSGVCNSLQNNWHIEIKSGLPVRSFHQGLLWETTGLSSRRLSTFLQQGSTRVFPSWSWIGWKGVIQHSSAILARAKPEIDDIDVKIEEQRIDFPWALGIKGLSTCWCEVLRLRGWLASLKISHRNTLINQNKSGGNDIKWRIFDKTSAYCGVARLATARFDEEDANYCCLLISRSRGSEVGLHFGTMWSQPRAVRVQSEEDVSKYLNLTVDSADWPEAAPGDFFTPFKPRDWAYLDILVLRNLGVGQFYERVGTGQVHEDAWASSAPELHDISII